MHKPFHDIENSYNGKLIAKWLEAYPELYSCKWIATSKIDGSNFGIHVAPEKSFIFQSRNRMLSPDENFFGYQKALACPEVAAFLAKVQERANKEKRSYVLFGELYGEGIQKRVNYGVEKGIRFFDLFEISEQRWVPPIEAQTFYGDLYVPIIGIFDGIEAARAINTEFPSRLNPIEGNIEEGVVIRPLEKTFFFMHDTILLKKKNEKFAERGEPKVRILKSPVSEEHSKLANLACSYITESRLLSVLSKHGEIRGMQDFPDLIKMLIFDYQKDFQKENEEAVASLSKKDLKTVTAPANTLACQLLKRHIMEVHS
jgi:hypothetical protein